MKTISRYIMTLALLLTAVTGAWAQSYEAKVFDVPASWTEDETHLSAADLPKDFVQITKDEAKALAVPDGDVVLVYGFVGENVLVMAFDNGTAIPNDDDDGAPVSRGNFIMFQTMAKVCYTTPAGPKVAWNASTKTGTFSMPGSDVVLTPIYAKAAAFATTGTEPEVKTLQPEAAEGVIAGTDAPLIAQGTGIVALAGESTTVTQGTLMYAIGTSDTQAPALTAFSATVPTAENVADDGATLYVWYYIQGADAPQGEAATLDNTFSDTEPACLTVQVLTNKFDITLNAANANTIEAGKATVTVAGAAATVTEGKLQGVKMGSEVKLEAKPGYKFRKVTVKKRPEFVPSATIQDLSSFVEVENNKDGTITLHMPTLKPSTYNVTNSTFSNGKHTLHFGYEIGSGTDMSHIGANITAKTWTDHTPFSELDKTIDITSGKPRVAILITGHVQSATCPAPSNEHYWGLCRYTNPVKVTYNLGGGSVSGSTADKVEYLFSGDALATTFAAPTREGYTFDGWYTSAEGGTKLTASNATSATTIYAHWNAIAE